MFRSNFQEERVAKDSKLQAVFSKLSGVLPRAEDLGNSNPKTMSSDIIESVLADTPVPVSTNWNQTDSCLNANDPGDVTSVSTTGPYAAATEDADNHPAVVTSLTQRLENELRRAKRTHLSCGEVLLPRGLLRRVAADIVSMAESEPYGVRGCRLYVLWLEVGCDESGKGRARRLATVLCDPATTATFELHLTLRQSGAGGWMFLPQFIRNLTRGGTIVVSPAYTLSKKKLYRSYREE